MENKATLENDSLIATVIAAQGVQKVGEKPFVVVPEGFDVRDLEGFLQNPLRKRGKVAMNDPASFIDFIKTHATDATRIYGQVDPAKFLAVLDDHGAQVAGNLDFKASYDCPMSKEWKSWTGMSGKQMTQIQFAEFIETNLVDIVSTGPAEPSGADMLQVATNFKAQKKVNFASGQVLANGQVQFTYQEELAGNAGPGPKGQINVPERFFIGIPVFENGDPYKIEAKLRWRISDGGGLAMWYELVRPHKTQEAAFMDVWKLIADGTGKTIWRGMPA